MTMTMPLSRGYSVVQENTCPQNTCTSRDKNNTGESSSWASFDEASKTYKYDLRGGARNKRKKRRSKPAQCQASEFLAQAEEHLTQKDEPIELQISSGLVGSHICTFSILPSKTVIHAKDALSKATGVPVMEQSLLLDSTLLEDEAILGELFGNESSVSLKMVRRGSLLTGMLATFMDRVESEETKEASTDWGLKSDYKIKDILDPFSKHRLSNNTHQFAKAGAGPRACLVADAVVVPPKHGFVAVQSLNALNLEFPTFGSDQAWRDQVAKLRERRQFASPGGW